MNNSVALHQSYEYSPGMQWGAVETLQNKDNQFLSINDKNTDSN